MLTQKFSILLCLALQTSAAAFHRQSRLTNDDEDGCAKVIVVAVRGATEGSEYGSLQSLIDKLQAKIPGLESSGLSYTGGGIKMPPIPDDIAIINLYQYANFEDAGVDKFNYQLELEVESCPNSALVLIAYDQGAHIIGDSLCGRSGQRIDDDLFPDRDPIDPKLLKNLRAVIQVGDPSNGPGFPWSTGGAPPEAKGLFSRTSIGSCKKYADKWRSYCDENDFFYDFSSTSTVKSHLGYVNKYGDEIVKYIANKLNAKGNQFETCMDQA